MESEPLKNKPADTPFKQQKLPSLEPRLTPLTIIGILLFIGTIFLPIGTFLIRQSNDVFELRVMYDGPGSDQSLGCGMTGGTPTTCSITFNFDRDISDKLYLYYEMDNFFQNHRRYVGSRSELQLQGEIVPESDLTIECDPALKSGGQLLSPCGLVANSFFTDIYTVNSGGTMNENDIAWQADKNRFKQPNGFKFKQMPAGGGAITDSDCDTALGTPSGSSFVFPSSGVGDPRFCYFYPDDSTTQYLYETYPDQISPIEGVTNEHFLVWMRGAALPTFRKLYGTFDENFANGDTLVIDVAANYEVASYGAAKGLVLTTKSPLGGKNYNLGLYYVVVGLICLGLSALCAVKHFFFPREPGSIKELHWE